MNTRITSAKNPLIQHVKQLSQQAKYRHEHKQTILDGIHLADAYLRSGGQPQQVIVATESLENPQVTELVFRLDERIPLIEVPGSLYERISSVEQGVALLCIIDLPEEASVDTALALTGDALLLDTIQDPGNVGTMLRTAAAAGIRDVYLSEGSASVWSPKVLRAGMGAHFGLQLHEHVSLHDVITNAAVPVIATSLAAEVSIYEKDLSQPTAWLFGNEGAGVSPALLRLCEKDVVIIPQADAVESLNVAASVAVCLFEQRRQRLS